VHADTRNTHGEEETTMAKLAKAVGFGREELGTRLPQPVVHSTPLEDVLRDMPEERAPSRTRRRRYVGRHRAPKDHGFGS
jgi:hypothetical protein